jgi:hypothetical protein
MMTDSIKLMMFVTGCQVPNQVEENYKIPKAQT